MAFLAPGQKHDQARSERNMRATSRADRHLAVQQRGESAVFANVIR